MKLTDFILKKIAYHIDFSYFYWYKAKFMYEENTGDKLNYNNPRNLREKLMWLTRYWQHPLKTVCADKYKVRDYIKKKGLNHILIPLIAVYDRVEDMNFSLLPDNCIIKCNHGSGFNIIVQNKNDLNENETKKTLKKWLNTNYHKLFCEIQYRDIPRKIICEKLISDKAPIEYQCWCINGIPESILVCRKNFDGTYDAASYSLDHNQLYDRIGEQPANNLFQKPNNLEQILGYAKILSNDFPFVRTDFYVVNDKIYFAELTFTPNGNYLTKYKKEFHERLGKKLILPTKL